MRTDDGYIIHQCLNGDPEAFGVLVDRYKEGIYAYAYAKLQNWQDAQDITQETFIQAYRKLHTLRRWDSFGSWLYRIASNYCKNWQMKASKRPDGDFIEDQNPAIIDKPSIESYHEKEMMESVQDALSSLSETYREVLTLYYFGGMDSNKIAEMLGVSPTAIRLRLSRARSQLREEIFNMMSATFQKQKLRSGFTFRIFEAIKRIKVNPISQTKSIPWYVSLALGMIAVFIGLNPRLLTLEIFNSRMDLPLSGESRVLDFGDIPVSVLKTAREPLISTQQGEGLSSKEPEMQNAFSMAPQAEPETWEKAGDMPSQRGLFSASVVNGKIYVIGGAVDRNKVLATVEEYDPETNVWTKKADMPSPRAAFSTSVINGKIYAIGGCRIQGVPLSTVEEYDPVTDTWKGKANMPTSRYALSSSTVNGKIYAIGGNLMPDLFGGVWLRSSAVEEYDPAANKWTKKANMPTARGALSTSVANGKIYAMGGVSQQNSGNFTLSVVEEYDPVANTWTKKTDMITPKSLLSTCNVDGMIYAIGGGDQVNDIPFSFVDLYDPENDSWARKSDMPTARVALTTKVIKGQIYAIGGISGFLYAFGNVPPILIDIEIYNTGIESYEVEPNGKSPTT